MKKKQPEGTTSITIRIPVSLHSKLHKRAKDEAEKIKRTASLNATVVAALEALVESPLP